MKRKISILLSLCMAILLLATGCADTEEEIMNTAANLANATKTIGEGLQEMGEAVIDSAQVTEDVHVTMVKGGTNYDYPYVTYGEAFDGYFSGTSWSYFQGTSKDSDVPVDVVEFKGNCLYLDTEVTALIQFQLDEDGVHFAPTFLSFNDVPQNARMLAALIEEVFTEAEQPQQTKPIQPQPQPEQQSEFLGNWVDDSGSITAEITNEENGYRIFITENLDERSWHTWVLHGVEDGSGELSYTGQVVENCLRENGTVMQNSPPTEVHGYMNFDERGTLNWSDMCAIMRAVIFFTRQ